MLLDVLTLLGALYVILAIVEYLCSLLRPTVTKNETPAQQARTSPEVGISQIPKDDSEACNSCGHRTPQNKPKIQYIIMTSEVQNQSEPEMDQYQSEILKRRKRIAAGEVKGFYLASNAGSSEANETNDYGNAERRRSNYGGDFTQQSDNNQCRSINREVRSCDDPSIQLAPVGPNMVGLKNSDIGYDIHPSHWASVDHKDGQSTRQQYPQHGSSYDERRSSLDTVPIKLIAPVTVIKSSGGSGSPFKVSENSAFTPIKPRREASVERRPGLLSTGSGPGHAQSFPDVSVDSGVNTAASNASSSSAVSTALASGQGPIQITVVMRPSNGQQQQQKASSTLSWTNITQPGDAVNRPGEGPASTEFNQPTVIHVCGSEPKLKERQPSPVRLRMVQTVTSAFKDPQVESKFAPTDVKGQKHYEPESPVKLRITQPDNEEPCKDSQPISRRPYVKSATTALASTAALARATATAGYKNYSNVSPPNYENVPQHLRPRTPPGPPRPSAELLAPQLLKKQSPLGDVYQRQGSRQYYADQPQMALTRAMRTVPQQGQWTHYTGHALNEPAGPQPYHPPTMASYESLGPMPASPRITRPDATLFAFCGSSTGEAPSQEPAERQARQQKRTRYSPGMVQHQYQEDDKPNVLWRPGEGRAGGGGPHQHSLSVDEGLGQERSRSRDRSRTRRQQLGFPTDDKSHLTKAATVDYYRASCDDEKGSSGREITDQGVPVNEEVLKGGNVSSKTKIFEALAEHETQDLDSQHVYHHRSKPNLEVWSPAEPAAGGSLSVPKPKKMERSHTVHTVRSLMAPDAYQYENAPYNRKNRYSYFDHGEADQQPPPSPRYNQQAPQFGGRKSQELLPRSPVTRVQPRDEVIEFPPASISPRAVQKEHATIGRGQQFHQAQVVQPQPQPQAQQWPSPSPPQLQPQPVTIAVERSANSTGDEQNVFEDEMSKMSIADKAKLFEQKAEEQAQQKKRYNTARHKTQPVTTEEVMKARSVINDQLAKPVDQQEHSHEGEQGDGTAKANAGASRNVIIYQRNPDKAKSVGRALDEGSTEKEQRESDHQSALAAVKPRKIVYLHSNENSGNSAEPEPSDAPPQTPSAQKSAGASASANETASSDQNNNEKSAKVDEHALKSQEAAGTTHSLVNGHDKPSVFPRSRLPVSQMATYKQMVKVTDANQPAVCAAGPTATEKTKKVRQDGHLAGMVTNGASASGHQGQMCSRILVNTDNDDAAAFGNGMAVDRKTVSGDFDSFCSKAQDLDNNGNEVSVDADSFKSIIKEPVIRLQHFSRPKPNRRHSACSNRSIEPNHEQNGAILIKL